MLQVLFLKRFDRKHFIQQENKFYASEPRDMASWQMKKKTLVGWAPDAYGLT